MGGRAGQKNGAAAALAGENCGLLSIGRHVHLATEIRSGVLCGDRARRALKSLSAREAWLLEGPGREGSERWVEGECRSRGRTRQTCRRSQDVWRGWATGCTRRLSLSSRTVFRSLGLSRREETPGRLGRRKRPCAWLHRRRRTRQADSRLAGSRRSAVGGRSRRRTYSPAALRSPRRPRAFTTELLLQHLCVAALRLQRAGGSAVGRAVGVALLPAGVGGVPVLRCSRPLASLPHIAHLDGIISIVDVAWLEGHGARQAARRR